MKVNWIEIDNIKSFKRPTKVVLNIDNNFIVGTNGSGKTTLFQTLSSCLLLLVPRIRPEMYTEDNLKKMRLNAVQLNIDLPKSFSRESDTQNVMLNISFEDSKDGLIAELEKYLSIFREHEEYIKNNFWHHDDIVGKTNDILNKIKSHKSFVFDIKFDVNINKLEIDSASRLESEVIINALEYIEVQRFVYNQLFKIGETTEVVEQGFHLVYIGADRTIGFPREISLGRGNVDEFLVNTAYGSSVDISNNIYSNSSFDYITQTLSQICEKYLYRRWHLLERKPLEKIKEFKELKTTIKEVLDLDFIVDEPGMPSGSLLFHFTSNGNNITFEQLSSGEKSLIYFIFMLANPDIKNSFIIVDEVEIHLHGNMQDVILDILFRKKSLNNEHFISTHSPKLINSLTISSVLRFYKEDSSTSFVNFRNDSKISSDYDVIRLINSQNNEKVFFADKVVLVEGIKDRILIEGIIRQVNNTKLIIEVIEVGGKQSLQFYRDYLNTIKVKNYIIADFDYLHELKGKKMSSLFITSDKKVDAIIKHKKSKDRSTLISAIEEFTIDEDKNNLTKVVEYLKSRGIVLKKSLTPGEMKQLKDTVSAQAKDRIFIISESMLANRTKYTGEIEDYLLHVKGADAFNSLVKYISRKDFLKDLVKNCEPKGLKELFSFIGDIVNDDASSGKKIIFKINKS